VNDGNFDSFGLTFACSIGKELAENAGAGDASDLRHLQAFCRIFCENAREGSRRIFSSNAAMHPKKHSCRKSSEMWNAIFAITF
jgi:hypothetical protein